MTDRELMQEALYVLTYVGDAKEIYSDTIESLRARLAQPEQEPVAWADKYDLDREGHDFWVSRQANVRTGVPLYTAPPQKHSEQWWKHEVSNAWAEGYEKGRASVKQPEQEPVWVEVTTNTGDKFILDSAVEADKIRAAKNVGLSVVPLYTAPPQRDEAPAKAVEWQGLTDEEMMMIYGQSHEGKKYSLGRAIEAKLKDKNHAV